MASWDPHVFFSSPKSKHKTFTFLWILSQQFHFLLNLIKKNFLSLPNLIPKLSQFLNVIKKKFTFSWILSQNFPQFHFISCSQTTTRLEKFSNKSLEIYLLINKTDITFVAHILELLQPLTLVEKQQTVPLSKAESPIYLQTSVYIKELIKQIKSD